MSSNKNEAVQQFQQILKAAADAGIELSQEAAAQLAGSEHIAASIDRLTAAVEELKKQILKVGDEPDAEYSGPGADLFREGRLGESEDGSWAHIYMSTTDRAKNIPSAVRIFAPLLTWEDGQLWNGDDVIVPQNISFKVGNIKTGPMSVDGEPRELENEVKQRLYDGLVAECKKRAEVVA